MNLRDILFIEHLIFFYPFLTHLDPFLIHSWSIFEPFWIHFRLIFDPFWLFLTKVQWKKQCFFNFWDFDSFLTHFDCFFIHFRSNFDPLLTHFLLSFTHFGCFLVVYWPISTVFDSFLTHFGCFSIRKTVGFCMNVLWI